MKYFLIAGERSGDLHGSYLIKALIEKDQSAEVIGYGGDLMKASGMKLLSHYKAGAFMGFAEVLLNLRSIFSRIRRCKHEIVAYKPDVLILIDYPGFNLRMAAFAKSLGIRTVYYISPKIWAWKKNRIHQIRKYVDQMFVIFPFEVSFYQALDYPVSYVGNPLVEQIKEYDFKPLDQHKSSFKNQIAFLPGSRKQEVLSSIPKIIELAELHPNWLFMVTAVDNLDNALYAPLKERGNIKVYMDQTYDVLKSCDAAVVTSGTATLETALIGTPQVVCYKAHPISYAIGRLVVKIKYISLVNLVMDKEVVKELLQSEYSIANVSEELNRLMKDATYRSKMKQEYRQIGQLLGEGSSSGQAADLILKQL